MRKLITILVACGAFAAAASPGALANNPHPEESTGKPEFSSQEINPNPGEPNPYAPGNAQFSPGAPFNEGEGTGEPGNGGAHYSENSRYDVACFQHQQHASH